MEGRTRQQCSVRWRRSVDQNIKKGRWSEEEDLVRVWHLFFICIAMRTSTRPINFFGHLMLIAFIGRCLFGGVDSVVFGPAPPKFVLLLQLCNLFKSFSCLCLLLASTELEIGRKRPKWCLEGRTRSAANG